MCTCIYIYANRHADALANTTPCTRRRRLSVRDTRTNAVANTSREYACSWYAMRKGGYPPVVVLVVDVDVDVDVVALTGRCAYLGTAPARGCTHVVINQPVSLRRNSRGFCSLGEREGERERERERGRVSPSSHLFLSPIELLTRLVSSVTA